MNYSGDRILLGSQRESRISKFRPWVLFVVPLIAILFQIYIPLFFEIHGLSGYAAAGDGLFLADAAQRGGRHFHRSVHRTGAGLSVEESARTVRHRQDDGRAISRRRSDCASTWIIRSSGCCWAFSFSSSTSSSPGCCSGRCSASRSTSICSRRRCWGCSTRWWRCFCFIFWIGCVRDKLVAVWQA